MSGLTDENRRKISSLTSENTTLKSQLASIQNSNKALSTEIASLKAQLGELQTKSAAASAQAKAASDENANLKRQVSDAQAALQELKAKAARLEESGRATADESGRRISALTGENTALKTQLGQLEASGKAATAQASALTNENATLKRQLADNQALIKSLQDKVTLLESRGASAGITDENRRKLLEVTDENIKLKADLSALKDKLGQVETKVQQFPTAVTADKVPAYFKKVIDSFNKNMKTDETSDVEYVIGGMDVELKAHVLTDKDNNPVISTPSFESLSAQKDTLSTIKFSIRPVPKAMQES